MKTHRTDALSLIPGLLFTALGILGLLDQLTLDLADARYVWPALLIVLGLAVLLSTGTAQKRQAAAEPGPTSDDEPAPGIEDDDPSDLR